MNRCDNCDRPDRVTWSHAFTAWLCTDCRHNRTETLLNANRTALPVTTADLTPTSDRPHP